MTDVDIQWDDWQMLRHLQQTGQIEWELFGSEGQFRVVGRNFVLDDKFPDGVWSLFSLPFFIGVKVLRGGLAAEWPALDWAALEAEGARLSEDYRSRDYV